MNKERLLELADLIEKDYVEFNGVKAGFAMNAYIIQRGNVNYSSLASGRVLNTYPNCNTTACIAGFACLMGDYEKYKEAGKYVASSDQGMFYDFAREYLELTHAEAKRLFVTQIDDFISGPQAAKVIRHLVDTGDVDWEKFLPEGLYDEDMDKLYSAHDNTPYFHSRDSRFNTTD